MNNTNTTNNANSNNNLNNMMTEAAIKEKYLRANKLKLRLAKFATILMIIAALAISNAGISVSNNKKDLSKTVYDNAEKLTDDAIKEIEYRNAALYELNEMKIVVVVEKDRSSYNDLQKKADKLFKDYKAGDSGMLFIVSLHKSNGWGDDIGDFFANLFGGGKQPYAYHAGRNLNKIDYARITDIFADNFTGSKEYNTGDYSNAVLNTFNALADDIDESYNIKSKNYTDFVYEDINSNTSNNSRSYISIAGVIAIFVLLFILLGSLTKKKDTGASKVYKSPFWFGMF